MSTHIGFEGIDCKWLNYVPHGRCWVCLDLCAEIKEPSFCMECKFRRQLQREDWIRDHNVRAVSHG